MVSTEIKRNVKGHLGFILKDETHLAIGAAAEVQAVHGGIGQREDRNASRTPQGRADRPHGPGLRVQAQRARAGFPE